MADTKVRSVVIKEKRVTEEKQEGGRFRAPAEKSQCLEKRKASFSAPSLPPSHYFHGHIMQASCKPQSSRLYLLLHQRKKKKPMSVMCRLMLSNAVISTDHLACYCSVWNPAILGLPGFREGERFVVTVRVWAVTAGGASSQQRPRRPDKIRNQYQIT